MSGSDVNIVLADRQKVVVDAWKDAMGKTANVAIHHGSICNCERYNPISA